MIRAACGWAFFAIILAGSLGPAFLLITPGPAPICDKVERRLEMSNYMPRTVSIRVCEVR